MGLEQHWKEKKVIAQQDTEQGFIRMTRSSSRIHISCPYSPHFIKRAREIGGRWRPRSGVWSFSGQSIRLILLALSEVFPDFTVVEGSFSKKDDD